MPILVRMRYFEKVIETKTFLWFLNFLLACIIFYSCELGRMLGLQGLPLQISIVWPATGFSLAALLLFGYKMLPGIFLGNFCYNMWHLHEASLTILAPLFTAFAVSCGSTIEAYLGAFILRRFSTPGYFNTVRDILIFLIPAGLLPTLISSIIGATSLYLFGSLPDAYSVAVTWITFWLGDTLGVYVIAPLIFVWSVHSVRASIKDYPLQLFFMVLVFIAIAALAFVWNFPVIHLFILWSLWVTYYFLFHGATLSAFLITLTSIIPTSQGYGSLVRYTTYDQLFLLVTFLEIIVATSLLLAAVIKEREAAFYLVETKGLFEQASETSLEDFKETGVETVVKEKLASLGLLTSSIAKQLHVPLQKMQRFLKDGLEYLKRVKQAFIPYQVQVESDLAQTIERNLVALEKALEGISAAEFQATKITEVIQEQAQVSAPGMIKVKAININTLVNVCLLEVQKNVERRFPDFSFKIIKNFDKNITLTLALPEDLAHALVYLLNSSAYSLIKKDEIQKAPFDAELTITTEDLVDKVVITVLDNGQGIEEDKIADYFQSFVENERARSFIGNKEVLKLSVAYDIIVYVYGGALKVESREGSFLKYIISLPKP